MKIFDKLKKDRIQAMRDKDITQKDLLGCVIAEASKQVKEPTDESVISTIKKFIKNIEDSRRITFEDYEKKEFDGEEDAEKYAEKIAIFSNKTETELGILGSYLPKQLTEDEIKFEIDALINDSVETIVMKDVMSYFKETFAGRYDGKVVSSIAKEMLK